MLPISVAGSISFHFPPTTTTPRLPASRAFSTSLQRSIVLQPCHRDCGLTARSAVFASRNRCTVDDVRIRSRYPLTAVTDSPESAYIIPSFIRYIFTFLALKLTVCGMSVRDRHEISDMNTMVGLASEQCNESRGWKQVLKTYGLAMVYLLRANLSSLQVCSCLFTGAL